MRIKSFTVYSTCIDTWTCSTNRLTTVDQLIQTGGVWTLWHTNGLFPHTWNKKIISMSLLNMSNNSDCIN